MLLWWNVDFERTFTPAGTWGVSTSRLTAGGVEFAGGIQDRPLVLPTVRLLNLGIAF